MRYLVHAQLKPEMRQRLLAAIEDESLGLGSVAYGEYVRNMQNARLGEDGTVRWVEVCYCDTPLEEEIPFWEKYFVLNKIMNAHSREKCRDLNGEERWACNGCDCTDRLEAHMDTQGCAFLATLRD